MYETFYKLSAEPFRLSPDPRFCFQHRTYRKAMTYMHHALLRAEGFIMITGRPGTGKTTLIHDLLRSLKPNEALVANLVTTQMTADDLIRLVAYSYNLDPEGADKVDVLVKVVRFLKQQYQQGRRPLLIVDEAQDMAEDALEELRLLTNLQDRGKQLLQIFLVGQEQLRDVVNSPSMEQLHQRMIAATHLDPLDRHDTEAYIKHRLRRVAWTGNPLISKEAYAMIQQYSQGIPRQINQICSRLFLHGSIEEKNRLGLADLRIVIDELREELLLSEETTENAAAVAWPADLSQETYEEEPRQPTDQAAKKGVPQARPATPPTTNTRQETNPAHQSSNKGEPSTPPSMPENEPAAAASLAASNDSDRDQAAVTPPVEPAAVTDPGASTHQELEQPATGTDKTAEVVTQPEAGTTQETSRQATGPTTEVSAVTKQQAGAAQEGVIQPANKPGEASPLAAQETSISREAITQTASTSSVAAQETSIAREPFTQPASKEREAAPDAPPDPPVAREQVTSSTDVAASPKHTVREAAALMPAERAPDQAKPEKARKRSSRGLLILTGLLTGVSVAVMFNRYPELPRQAAEDLMTWAQSSKQNVISRETENSSADITETAELTGKGTVLREPPAVGDETKTAAAETKTAEQQPERVIPQTSTVPLEEKLQQSGLLVERMDDDILKVNLSSDGMFAFDSAEIKDGARPALGKLADVLRKQDELTIQVVGHTDSSGAAEYNLHLSQRRAKAVADYLINQGLPQSSIESEGRGDRDTRLEQPATYNPGLKRRVEIYIRQARTS